MQAVVDDRAACILEAAFEAVHERVPAWRHREVDDGRHTAKSGDTRTILERVRDRGRRAKHIGQRVRWRRLVAEVDVAVDRPRQHIEAGGVNLRASAQARRRQRGDALAGDPHVGVELTLGGDDTPAPDDDVVVHGVHDSTATGAGLRYARCACPRQASSLVR
jgi:hypothetical protein